MSPRVTAAGIRAELPDAQQNWPRLFEQIFRIDKWSVYRGYAAMRIGSGLK